MKQQSIHQEVVRAIDEGWSQGGGFFGSILAGMLLGLLADHWLGTEPWLVIIGSLLGIYSGSVNIWNYSKKIGEPDHES